MDKKNIFYWSLYDFANSISVVVFFLYFSQWLVIDNKVQDIWYNLLFVGSTILLLLTAPVGGIISDRMGIKLPFLKVVTILQFIALVVTSIVVLVLPHSLTGIVLAILGFMIANYLYMFSFTFYNAILRDIASEKKLGFVSGIGQSANWIGQIVGLLVTLPLATGAVFLLGEPGRAQTFLPATLLFFLLSTPMLFLYREKTKAKKITINLLREYRNVFRSFREMLKSPGLGRYLLGFFFFNDALITAVNNFPIYLAQVFKISDTQKSILIIEILATSAIGAFVVGWISDKVGLKRTLIGILVGWALLFPTMGLLTNFFYFTLLSIVMGFFFGAAWSVGRAMMASLTPKHISNHAFSYYTLAERFSTFVGPIVWGLITLFLIQWGSLRYQIALVSMTLFVLIGIYIIKDLPELRKE